MGRLLSGAFAAMYSKVSAPAGSVTFVTPAGSSGCDPPAGGGAGAVWATCAAAMLAVINRQSAARDIADPPLEAATSIGRQRLAGRPNRGKRGAWYDRNWTVGRS